MEEKTASPESKQEKQQLPSKVWGSGVAGKGLAALESGVQGHGNRVAGIGGFKHQSQGAVPEAGKTEGY